MVQTLKISIARGGCRFATPLYLGAKYVLSFEGERSDEADSVLFVKPRSDDATDATSMSALAQSEYDSTVSGTSLNLNKQVLLDWFKDCGECDVDGYVDAHCYVFDSDGAILADSDVTIEYKPVQFAVDETGFDDWTELEKRLAAVEEQAANHDADIAVAQTDIEGLKRADEDNLEAAKADAKEKADEALEDAKTYADNIKMQLARMQYVKCDDESTTETEIYHRVFLTKNARGEHVVGIDETKASIEGTDPTTAKYVYTDTKQTVTGEKTFQAKVTIDGDNGGVLLVPTQAEGDDSQKAASTAFVGRAVTTLDEAFRDWWAAQLRGDSAIEWQGQHTFTVQIRANGGVKGNLTGDVTAENVDTGTLDVTGDETHSGDETHEGSVTLAEVVSPTGITPELGWLTAKNGVGLDAVWTVFRVMAGLMGGHWYITPAGGTLTAYTSGTSWRYHDRQNGLAAPWATALPADYVRYADGRGGLYWVFFPNVTTVGSNAFRDITTVRVCLYRFPNLPSPECASISVSGFASLVKAESEAFRDCDQIASDTSNSLNGVIFPKLEEVGDGCFRHVSNITSVDLPRLKRADWLSFYACSDVTSFSVGSEVLESELASIDTALTNWFESNWATLKTLDIGDYTASHVGVFPAIQALYAEIGTLPYTYFDGVYRDHTSESFNTVILDSAQLVGDAAFANAQNLTTLELPQALVVGIGAFYRLGWFRSTVGNIPVLSLPKCRFVGRNAFGQDADSDGAYPWRTYWGSPCAAVYAPELTHVCYQAFMMDRSITKFYAPKLKRIAARVFWGCIGLVESTYTDEDGNVHGTPGVVTFDECVEVGEYAFYGRGSNMAFTKLSLNSCTSIGASAFANTPNMTDLYLGAWKCADIVDANPTGWGLATSVKIHGSDGYAYYDGSWKWRSE